MPRRNAVPAISVSTPSASREASPWVLSSDCPSIDWPRVGPSRWADSLRLLRHSSPGWVGPVGQAFQPDEVSHVRLESLTYQPNVLSYGTAWVQGFLEGGLVTFLSIYLLLRGYTEGEISFLVGGLFAGVVLVKFHSRGWRIVWAAGTS